MAPADTPKICFDDDLFLGLRLGYGEAFLKITRRCNNRCRFCCDRTFQDGHLFPLPQALTLLEEGRERGLRKVVFSGGEPTVHPDFMAMLAAAGRLGYERISVITNGRFFFYRKACRRAVKVGLTTAVITLLSDEAAVHDHLCGVDGAFEQSVTAVRNFVALDPSLASVVITVTRPAVARLPQIVRFLHELGVGGAALHAVAPVVWVDADPEVFFEPEAAREPLRQAVALAQQLGLPMSVKNFPPQFLEDHEHLITESEEFFPEVRDTEKRVPLFRSLLEPAGTPVCADLDCATCYRRPFCDYLVRLDQRLREDDVAFLRVEPQHCDPEGLARVEASRYDLCLAGAPLAQLELLAAEHGWAERVTRLELDHPPGSPLAHRWPGLRTVVAKSVQSAQSVQSMDAWWETNGDIELVLLLNAQTQAWVTEHQALLRARGRGQGQGQRLVLALDVYERLRDAREQSLDLRRFFERVEARGLTLENIPRCFGPEATHRARPFGVDLGLLDDTGGPDPLEACHLFLREGWYDHSHRCRECHHRADCPGLPLNQLTAFGYRQLEPVGAKVDSLVSAGLGGGTLWTHADFPGGAEAAVVVADGVGAAESPETSSAGVVDGVLYIHPYGHQNDFQVPTGLVGLMNRVAAPKLGRYAAEVRPEEVAAARCIALDLHWFFSLETVHAMVTELKRQNPSAPIILGGITASFYARYLLERYPIDYLIQGDAELAFGRLVEALAEGGPVGEIPNVHRPSGPAARSEPVSPKEYARTDYLTLDWFPALAERTRHGHRLYAKAPFHEVDHFHPFVPLNRGCRFDCNFCFGAYQRDVFGRGQVDLDAETLGRRLDSLDADPDFSFVTLVAGTEDVARLDRYREAFAHHRRLGASMMMCALPSLEQVQWLRESFDGLYLDFTNPADIPQPLRRQGLDQRAAEDRLLELARQLDDHPDCVVSISFLSRTPSPFRDRLRAARLETLNLKDNFEWALPKPNRATLDRDEADPKAVQAEHFRSVSRANTNYTVARALAPALYPFLDYPPLKDLYPRHRILAQDAGLTALAEAFARSYDVSCVTLVDEVVVRMHLRQASDPVELAAMRCVVPGGDLGPVVGELGTSLGLTGIDVRGAWQLPEGTWSAGAQLVLNPILRHGDAPSVELARVEGLGLWILSLPPHRSLVAGATLQVAGNLSRGACHFAVLVDAEPLLTHRWGGLTCCPRSAALTIDTGEDQPVTEQTLLRPLSGHPFCDPAPVALWAARLMEAQDRGRLGRWTCSTLERRDPQAAWRLSHPVAGTMLLCALPPGAEPGFFAGRGFDLLYRLVDSPTPEDPAVRRLLDVLGALAREVEGTGA